MKYKEQVKTLLEKSDSDDQLIDALKKEVDQMRSHIRRITQEAKSAKDAEAVAGRRAMKFVYFNLFLLVFRLLNDSNVQ